MKKSKNANIEQIWHTNCIQMPIADLTPNASNPRKITPARKAQLRKSLEQFGNLSPITWNKTTKRVIGGNQRLEGYRDLGHSHVDVWVVELDETKEKAAVLALNNHAGEWDNERLAAIIAEIKESGDLDLVGFDQIDIDKLLNSIQGGSDVDAAVDASEKNLNVLVAKWGVSLGQVWELGEHRIGCGDCTDKATVLALLRDGRPHLMVTDPPYGVEYDANWRNERVRGDGSAVGYRAVGKVESDDRSDWREAWALFPGDVAYVWHASLFSKEVAESLEASGFPLRCLIVWTKNNFVIGRGDYQWQHELLWYAVRKGKPGHFLGGRKQTTLWQIDKPQKSETGHSTQKPIECMARPIRNNSKPGDLVYEPFSGSGTTIIACEQLKRKCRAIEINPQYVAMAIERWVKATGKEPNFL